MKTCKKCDVEQPLDAFAAHPSTRDRLQTWCKTCRAKRLREHRQENPDYWREYNRRYRAKYQERINAQRNARYAADREGEARKALAWRIKRDFGLTLDEYDALVAQPCRLCGATENIVVDHCHQTNRVRGPLCQTCNKALGMLGEDPARLRQAADYIEGK